MTLPSGSKIPYLGLGLWKSDKGTIGQVINAAIDAGWRHFDCASDYGNEAEVGEALSAITAAGKVARSELFITSKLWNTYHHREHVEAALDKTLQDLKLEYIDLFLIHFPISLKYVDFSVRYPPEWVHDPSSPKPAIEQSNATIRETWEAMENLLSTGKVRNIGVSNFSCALLMDLLKYAKVKPAMNQFEIHPLLSNDKLIRFCQSSGIAVTGFSPLGPTSYVPLNAKVAAMPALFDHKLIQSIANKYNKTGVQVLLRWQIERKCVCVPKTANKIRLIENLNIFDFSLTADEIRSITDLNENRRFNDPGEFANIPIWD